MKGKSNKLWKHLHNVSGCENHGTAMTVNDCDGEHIINPKYIADIFNNHFVNITENMDLYPDTDITYTEKLYNYISGRIPENIFFTIPLMSSQYVLQQLATLDISKTTGLDNISAKFLKMSSHLISILLCHICNLSIRKSNFPSIFKL